MLWMLLQAGSTNLTLAAATAIGFIYYMLSLKQFSKNFRQVVFDRETINTHLQELEVAQKSNNNLKQRTDLALAGSGTSVLDWNYTDNTYYISPSWKEMLGYKDEELSNNFEAWARHVHKDDLGEALHLLRDAHKNRDSSYQVTHRLKHKDGHYIWIFGKAQIFYTSDGEVSRMVGTHIDISHEREIQEALINEKVKLKHQANHDVLTGLANRTLFSDRLKQSIVKAKHNNTTVALLFIDLDHFKEINDSIGHLIGDKVLQKVSIILQKQLRNEDTIARIGGDEFTIILENLEHSYDASSLAQKLLESLAKPLQIEAHELYISSSIGISLFPLDGDNPMDLLKYADSAMYKAKAEGRNNFQFYSKEMTALALQRVELETDLRDAIKNDEFLVYYQAQVDGTNNKIIGMEALVRWIHPTKGLISPADFIPLAESTGLIIEIDKYVMKTAMLQTAAWYAQSLNPGVLAMNLAVKQLQDKNFISYFKNLMQETNCPSSYLELEVTEGQIMTNPEEAIKILNKISDLGIELAVDDFGTGYSSLSYLKKLPINKLKIDKSFVDELPDDEEDAAIAKAVIALAQSLNLRIIAEGVETQEQKDFLLKHGCSNIQGYFYSKPLPAGEFEHLLQKGIKNMTK